MNVDSYCTTVVPTNYLLDDKISFHVLTVSYSKGTEQIIILPEYFYLLVCLQYSAVNN